MGILERKCGSIKKKKKRKARENGWVGGHAFFTVWCTCTFITIFCINVYQIDVP